MGCSGSKPTGVPTVTLTAEPEEKQAVTTEAIVVEATTPSTTAVLESAPSPPPGCPFHKTPPAAPRPITEFPRVPPHATLKPTKYERVQDDIDELLAKHADAIIELRGRVAEAPHYKADDYDDIFLLRFLLSNGTIDKAETNLRSTFVFRHEQRERLARAASNIKDPKHEPMSKLSIADLLEVTTLADEPILVVRTGRSDVRALMNAYSEDEVVEYLNYSKETAFQRCDAATKRTRRLVKMITILDMNHSKMSGNDRRFFKALGRASKDAEIYYPQLLALTVPVNPPAYIGILWQLGKRFMPARTIAKIRFCSATDTTNAKQHVGQCPFVGRNFTPETLPTFLGGTMPPVGRLRLADDP